MTKFGYRICIVMSCTVNYGSVNMCVRTRACLCVCVGGGFNLTHDFKKSN